MAAPRKGSNRAAGASAISAVAVFIATAGSDPAHADNYRAQCTPGTGFANGPCRHHDGSPEFWWGDTLSQAWRDAGNYAKGRLDMSDVDPVNVANPQNTGVWTFQQNYGNTPWRGYTPCVDVNNDQKCRRSQVHINSYHGPYSQDVREHLFCHEFGHPVGLLGKGHGGEDSCIEDVHNHRDYDSHDRGHLNQNY